jgi:hypothetical protein
MSIAQPSTRSPQAKPPEEFPAASKASHLARLFFEVRVGPSSKRGSSAFLHHYPRCFLHALFLSRTLWRDGEVDLNSHRLGWIRELDDVDFSRVTSRR